MSKIGNITLLLAAAAGASVATASKAEPYIYAVTVHSNHSTAFTDCFTFDHGVLAIQSLGNAQFPYTPAPTRPKYYYIAVSSPEATQVIGANLAFSGYKVGTSTSGSVQAVGADTLHNSYVVTGTAVPACPPQPEVAGHSTWFARPAGQ